MTSTARWLCVPLLALVGCGDDASPPAALDASTLDAPLDAVAATELGVASDAPATCDVGAPPVAASMLPTIQGSMTIVGGDGGVAAPTPSGGDATGAWVMTGAVMYWPAVARGQLDPAAGSISGTGWGVFEGGRYRLSTDLVLRVDSSAAGVVVRPSMLASRGAYTANGSSLALAPECSTSGGTAPSGASQLGFSRDADDRGRLFLTVAGAAGTATIVIDLRRIP